MRRDVSNRVATFLDERFQAPIKIMQFRHKKIRVG
jgi:hypothetical protein